MSLTGVEWQELAVYSRASYALDMKKNLTEEEECVIIWLKDKVNVLTEKKVKK